MPNVEPTPIPGNAGFSPIPYQIGSGLGTGGSLPYSWDPYTYYDQMYGSYFDPMTGASPFQGSGHGITGTSYPFTTVNYQQVQTDPGAWWDTSPDPFLTGGDAGPTVQINPPGPSVSGSPGSPQDYGGLPAVYEEPTQGGTGGGSSLGPPPSFTGPLGIGVSPTGGTFQGGTYIPSGGFLGASYGPMGYSLTGIPGTFVTTPSGQTYSTAIGMFGLGAMNAAGGGSLFGGHGPESGIQVRTQGEGGGNEMKHGISAWESLPPQLTPAQIAALLASTGSGLAGGHKYWQMHYQPTAAALPPSLYSGIFSGGSGPSPSDIGGGGTSKFVKGQ